MCVKHLIVVAWPQVVASVIVIHDQGILRYNSDRDDEI